MVHLNSGVAPTAAWTVVLPHAFTKRLFDLPNVHFIEGGVLAFNAIHNIVDTGFRELVLGVYHLMVLPDLRETENPL